MPTYYVDLENGNDANAGTSFATRWKTLTSGATLARIAPGDTIRVMASPDPTPIGDAKWTGGGRLQTINISSSTNTAPIIITTSAAHGLVTGDFVSIVGHSINTNANGVWWVREVISSTMFSIFQMSGESTTGNGNGGASGNITNVNNCIVRQNIPFTGNIALCGGLGQKPAWTASTNVTTAQNTTNYKEGYSSAQIAIAAGFTTGKAAYYTLATPIGVTEYTKVSFWVQQTTGTVGAAGSVYLALCNDTTGNTVSYTCPIPSLGGTNIWYPVVVDLGTPITNIGSVAFYVVTDNGAQTFLLDNIIACGLPYFDTDLKLTSLISKSDGTGDEGWYPIQSINSGAIMLANSNISVPTSNQIMGYNGTSETVTTYQRDPIPVATGVLNVNDSGTAANRITFSGGWSRADMSTQTGQTWCDGLTGVTVGYVSNTKSYVTLDRLNACRFSTGLTLTGGTGVALGSCYYTGCNTGIDVPTATINCSATALWVHNNATTGTIRGYGWDINAVKVAGNARAAAVGDFTLIVSSSKIGSMVAGNSGVACVVFNGSNNVSVGTLNVTNSSGNAVRISQASNIYFNGGATSGNVSSIAFDTTVTNIYGSVFLNNFSIAEATEVAGRTIDYTTVYSNRHDNTDNNSWQWHGVGTINQQSVVVDSPAVTSWKMNPTATTASATTPLRLKLGTVVCGAGSLVTVTARMRRSNTGLTMRLICPGGQISGVSSDVISDMTAAADTWETLTITFTPTKAGGVDIYAHAFGGTTYSGYVCNLSASQA